MEVKMSIILNRFYSDLTMTRGVIRMGSHIICHTLELPWLRNEKNVSCIPEGIYPCWKAKSEKFGDVFYIDHVFNRSGILIHSGNTIRDTRGCILVGLDCDLLSVLQSRLAMQRLHTLLPEKFNLEVRS